MSGARGPHLRAEEREMLYEFVTVNRDVIIARTMDRLFSRVSPPVSSDELESGVPVFLTQLSETLRLEATATPFAADAIGSTAARHGAELRALGFSVSQVVHDYGDICQAITELAIEQRAPITTEEFHTLNRCLDTAIAEAVTEHARVTAAKTSTEETERLGLAAHELRDGLNTALLAFNALKRGTVPINGSTGAVLGRSLLRLAHVVDNALAEVRLATGKQSRERMRVLDFVEALAPAVRLHAEYRALQFTVDPVDPALNIAADPQLLTSAIMNLLQNAFKSTRAGGRVVLRARQDNTRVLFEVEDECGGIPESAGDPFQPFGERRGRDRTGLGLGLSIARNAVRAHGGDIHIRNMPGTGCVFVVEIPLAVDTAEVRI
jgi:signal transduction histidine kinase